MRYKSWVFLGLAAVTSNSMAMMSPAHMRLYWIQMTNEQKLDYEERENQRIARVYQWLNQREQVYPPGRPVFFDGLFDLLVLEPTEKDKIYMELNNQPGSYVNYLYEQVQWFNAQAIKEIPANFPYLSGALKTAVAKGEQHKIPICIMDILQAFLKQKNTRLPVYR